MKLGLLKLQDFQGIEHYFWKQIQVFDVSYISLVLPTGEFAGAGYYKDLNHADIEEISRNHKGKNYIYATDNQGNRTKLITNAIDAVQEPFVNEKGQIKIFTEITPDEKNVLIRITDKGVGISEDVRQKIFDQFFTTKPVGNGIGLGLAIAY